ncbi:cortex morphogenetic protein CmpA [Aliibacillus thermotolerans]|uniref:Cortex morphogenetic protein CmpA n=1 Tax=Aliibacillus thermotolerans TaxID=1834418 RepID=A0ABW0UAG0_9BACI|nr:cortex morphogenetic protein CmpA [Aliibacillus thermotolerans]MDA3129591.1 cortex morphogenetic protein CmpA [Aliibacillus thermotolerans]
MPGWFMRQLQRAFFEKNYDEVRTLNQCWFGYLTKLKKLN